MPNLPKIDQVFLIVGTYTKDANGKYRDNANVVSFHDLEENNTLTSSIAGTYEEMGPAIAVNIDAKIICVDKYKKTALLIVTEKTEYGNNELLREVISINEPITFHIPNSHIFFDCGIGTFPDANHLADDNDYIMQLSENSKEAAKLCKRTITPMTQPEMGSEDN